MERTMQDNFQRIFDLLQQNQNHSSAPRQSDYSHSHQIEGDTAGSEAGDEVLEGNQSPNAHQFAPTQTMTMKIDNLLDTFTANSKVGTFTDATHTIESTTDLDALVFEYGATESITPSLLSTLPSRELGDALMDHFFRDINWLRQPMSQKRTRAIYESFWATGPKLTADNINVYAIVVILMATSICSIERPDLVPGDARAIRLTARRLFYAGRRALLVSTMLGREDIHQVMGYSLASRFLLLDRRVTEAWTCVANAVKTAHSIGLHRDGTKLHLSAQEAETRRRVWSLVYFTDRTLCMTLGRPTQIDDNVVDTQLPDDKDDLDVFSEMMVRSPVTNSSVGAPSPLTYTRHRHQLAVIMGKIIGTYQNLHSPAHYGDIIAIDKQLEQHRKTLPSFFRSEIDANGELTHIDTTWDEMLPFVPIHRYLLESDIDHIRVSLHRPYLLRPSNKAGHRYEFSRRSCIAAAHRSILLRKDIIGYLKAKFGEGRIPKAYHLHLGTYKTLNSLIIVGMYLVVTPDAEDAEMLLGHLRFYSDMFRRKRSFKGYVRDEMKDREETIINLFLQRIEETRANAPSNAGKTGKGQHNGKRGSEGGDIQGAKRIKKTSEEDTAGVLLDLNQSGRNKADWTSSPKPIAEIPVRKESEGDIMAPWPYLPLNTHQNSTPSGPPSLSNGSDPSPVYESGQEDGSHPGSSSTAQSTNAQQLFESWFRYNAFDTMDFDTLNSNDYQQQQPSSQASQQPQQPSVFAVPHAPSKAYSAGGKTTIPYNNNSNTSNVQFSTLPAPTWRPSSNTNSGSQAINSLSSIPQSYPPGNTTSSSSIMTSNPAMTNTNSANLSSTSTNMPFSIGSNAAGSADPFSDASFDPNFWQRCVLLSRVLEMYRSPLFSQSHRQNLKLRHSDTFLL
jgi:hypothetical protein